MPRFTYWTIIVDGTPTAFRARARADLLPTLHQLQRTQPAAVLKWFSRGRLWESPEQEREAAAGARAERGSRLREQRGRDWRPGGQHADPRARFKPSRDKRRPPAAQGVRTGDTRRAESHERFSDQPRSRQARARPPGPPRPRRSDPARRKNRR